MRDNAVLAIAATDAADVFANGQILGECTPIRLHYSGSETLSD